MPEKELLAFLDGRYRKIEDCEAIKEQTESRVAKLSLDIAVIKTKLTFLQWLGGVVGTAVVSITIKYLFGA